MANEHKRFWEKVRKTETCWEWTSPLNYCGRGFIRIYGKNMQAHRAAYILLKGEIPDGMCVLHTCDNPSCVNPDHLYLGTQKQNARDREKRGRHGKGWKILKPEQVKAIREEYRRGANAVDLGEKYNRDPLSIYRIVSGESFQENGKRKPVGG